MSNTLEDLFKNFLSNELQKTQESKRHVPIAQFCKENNISRVTIWRAEKNGTLKLHRIGRKVFVPFDWAN